MQFDDYHNFYLETKASSWGEVQLEDISKLLNSVIKDFYSNFFGCKINTSSVIVLKTTLDFPEIIKDKNHVLIYLCTCDRRWSQYSFQFAHELCHFIIDNDFPPRNDKFGWFEESLCELASLYTLNKMSITWQTNPPYCNWIEYSMSLKEYVDERVYRSENSITKPFSEWLNDYLPELYANRYDREKNLIIAIQLLPIFTFNPDLWKIVLCLKNIIITDDMTLEDYLFEIKKLIPTNLFSSFDKIIHLMIIE